MLTIENSTYDNWKEYFLKRLTSGNQFELTHSLIKESTDIEIYTQQIGNPQTTIEVGYLDNISLIYLQILHPDTPGHNRQQQIEYFYKYQFSNDETYGGPGLDFEIDNLKAINRQLNRGLEGKEVVYYKNGKLIKSELSISYSTYIQDSYNFTHRFNDDAMFVRLIKKLLGIKNKYEAKEVDLRSIFSGLK